MSFSVKIKVLGAVVARFGSVSSAVISSSVILTVTDIIPSPDSLGVLSTVPPVSVRDGPVGGELCIVILEKLKVSGSTGLLNVSRRVLLS